ncbi:MAG: 4Fe-4S dicluster domain-containing protein [Methanobacteriota archaeon]|nr:MAG: 4Fe-4S dicluster domain-containing protein [Euryarchaeota archaeon]
MASRRLPAAVERDLHACLQCGYCNFVCPIQLNPGLGWESYRVRGKMYHLRRYAHPGLLERIAGDRAKISPEFVERVYNCTACGYCQVACHVEIKFNDRWEELKEWFVENGIGPLERHKALRSRVIAKRNPYDEPHERRADWIPRSHHKPKHPEVLFFAGCTASYRQQKIAVDTLRVLDAAGVEYDILGTDEWCCGSPLIRTGQTDIVVDEADGLVKHNLWEIEKRGIDTVVTACAGCFMTLSHNYPMYAGMHDFKLYHMTQFIDRLISQKKLTLKKPLAGRVAYHDPCHIGRHFGIFEEPRRVLKAFPESRYLEMPRNRLDSLCCGAGGGFKIQFNDRAEHIASLRVEEAKSVGADMLVSACPFCVTNLSHGARRAGIDMPVAEMVSLVADSVS